MAPPTLPQSRQPQHHKGAPPPPPPKAGTTGNNANRHAVIPPPPRTGSSPAKRPPSQQQPKPTFAGQGFDGQIRFVDDEVTRMHNEIEKRERERRLQAPSRTGRVSKLRPKKSGVSFRGFMTRVAVFYVLIAYYFVCPTDDKRERAVCRQLDRFTSALHSLEPHARPYIDYAAKKAEPYVADFHSRTEPYLTKVRPYVDRADSIIEPWTKKTGQLYHSHLYPGIVKSVHASHRATKPYVASAQAQYQKSLAPSVEWYSREGQRWYKDKAEKHVTKADSVIRKTSKQAYEFVAPAVPFAHHHFRNTVLPASQTAYKTSHETYFEHLHPRVVVAGGHLHEFWRTTIIPAWHRFYSLYIAPQVAKIQERVFEYKSKKNRVEAEAQVQAAAHEQALEHEQEAFTDFVPEVDQQFPVPAVEDVLSGITEPAAEAEAVVDKQRMEAEKRAKLEGLQTSYEEATEALAQSQLELLVNRLVDIRTQANTDIFDRFDAPLIKLNTESEKMVERLTNFLARDDGKTKEQKLVDGETLRKKAVAKVKGAGDKVLAEVEKYSKDIIAKEHEAVDSATSAIDQLISKAQEELGHQWTYLDSVTAKDWTRYRGLHNAQEKYSDLYFGLQAGVVANERLKELQPLVRLQEAKEEVETIVEVLDSTLEDILSTARGSVVGSVVDAVTGSVREAQVVLEDSSERLVSSAASVASVARESANSILDAARGVPESVTGAFRGEPTPTNIIESISSVASAAADSAQTALGDASQAALSAIGIEPSPTNLQQTVDYVTKAAPSVISSAASAAYDAVVTDLPSSASSVANGMVDVVETLAGDAASSASSIASEISSAASVASSKVMGGAVTKVVAPAEGTLLPTKIIVEAVETAISSAASVTSVIKSAVHEHIEL